MNYLRIEFYRLTAQKNKYRPGDRVYLFTPGSRGLQGPFLIANVSSTAYYKLCLDDGTTANGGNEVHEENLTSA